jgi:hypothetical protein
MVFFVPLKEGLRVLLSFSLKTIYGVSNLGISGNPDSTESCDSQKIP